MASRSEGKPLSKGLDGKLDSAESYNSDSMYNMTMKNGLLKKKLELKSEALMVLSQELDQCRAQRDRFKLLAERIQDSKDGQSPFSDDSKFRTVDLLMETQEKNKCLRLQVETLRQKLSDAQADITVLRTNNHGNVEHNNVQLAPDIHQREEMIQQLEHLNYKCTLLRAQLLEYEDEKEELETERDALKCKVHRLNHELSNALGATDWTIDWDDLITENRYLQERLQLLIEDKKIQRESLARYKGELERKLTKGTIQLGGNSGAGSVMTYKQVEELLKQDSPISPQKSLAAVSDLRRICWALLDGLNDKSLALVHQRKTTRILASRLGELDTAVNSPTMKLLKGYVPPDVDAIPAGDSMDAEDEAMSTTSDGQEKREDDSRVSEAMDEPVRPVVNRISRGLPLDLPELPKNLGDLVEKALINLRVNGADKQ